MEKNKNFGFKSAVLLIFVGLILISFAVLKIKDISRSKKKVDIKITSSDISSQSIFSQGKTGEMKQFSSYQDLASFIESKKNFINQNFYRSSEMMDKNLDFSSSIKSPESSSSGDSSNLDFSPTNIQVQGVDEADIIKTDGQYIYALVSSDLYIIKAYPEDSLEIVNKINFSSRPTNIYIKDNKLVVFGEQADFFIMEKMAQSSRIWPGPYKNEVFLKVFDIADKKNVVEVRDLKIEGAYFNSRLIGDYLYLVVNNYNFNDNILPRVSYQNQELTLGCKEQENKAKCFDPAVYYFETDYESLNFSSIFSINIFNDSEDFQSSFYLLPSGQNLYASLDNIYITYGQYLDEYELESEILLDLVYSRLSEDNKKLITEINNVSEKILSLSEKKIKIREILDKYFFSLNEAGQKNLEQEIVETVKTKYPNLRQELETTVIHKIAVTNGRVEPIAQGVISGSILNQFSMDEYNGYFRVASTNNTSWSKYFSEDDNKSYNNVYVLDDNMKVVGEIENLAPEERIYSVRFMGDKAFVVTFKQVDPLFSLDLKNPYAPKVLGELKIPGFSNYLHPMGDGKLIGFGKEVEVLEGDRVVSKGLKMSLFDISSDDPKEIDSYTIGDTGSESLALYDHKAFLFSASKNIIVVPVTITDKAEPESWGKTNFNGFLIFEIIDNSIKLKGRISHLTDDLSDFSSFFDYSAKRSLYIEDNLYTFSEKMIKINDVKNLSELNFIKF